MKELGCVMVRRRERSHPVIRIARTLHRPPHPSDVPAPNFHIAHPIHSHNHPIYTRAFMRLTPQKNRG
jgi:hypothetical protein